jgi:predicted PolB exonuclease-like 3'-5' exonuclease
MLDRPLAAFDIETMPDPDLGRKVLGFTGDDDAVVHAMVEQRLKETEATTEYPQLPYHRIVTICAAWLDPDSGRFKLGALGGRAMDERGHLEGFFNLFRESKKAPRLISWNGGGFDLPVIRYRSMIHGVAAPEFYRRDGEWKWNNYQNRFHDMHVDLMDVLSGYGASTRIGLGTLAPILNLIGKSFLTEPVYAHILRGEEDLVREYCKLDVLQTLLIYLVWAVHCGQLAVDRLREYVAIVRHAVEAEEFAAWQEIGVSLENWPAWAQVELFA